MDKDDWDFIDQSKPRCPACGSEWPDAPDVFVSEEQGIAQVNGFTFSVTDSQGRVLTVLRASLTRWVTAEDLNVLAHSDLPDADVPDDLGVIESAVRSLRVRLGPSGYAIQSRRNFGYRLIKQREIGHGKMRGEKTYRKR